MATDPEAEPTVTATVPAPATNPVPARDNAVPPTIGPELGVSPVTIGGTEVTAS